MKDIIKNAMLAGSPSLSFRQFTPKEYKDRQKQYFNDETRLFTEQYAKYSADYVYAEIQGLDPEQPFVYFPVHIRMSDIVRSSSAISYEFDNFKNIDIAERQYTYLRIGAKVKAMGNTWLVINPDNVSNVLGKSIIQRCDSTWHYLDFYGNVHAEPVCIDRRDMRGVDPDSQRATMIATGYFTLKMQYNEATRQIDDNTRLILGTGAYRVAGHSDAIQEFTDDDTSIRMLMFRAMFEEVNDAIDDMDNRIAGGKTFRWDLTVSGTTTLKVGETEQLTASSVRTSEEHTEEVENTVEHPVSYLWESSDENVAEVDAFGNITANSEGEATITCTLEQNQNITRTLKIIVDGSNLDPHISFTSTPPKVLRLYDETTITAQYYENGEVVDGAEITWVTQDADKRSYTATATGNNLKIKCWGGSVKPLYIIAQCNGQAHSFSMELEGI